MAEEVTFKLDTTAFIRRIVKQGPTKARAALDRAMNDIGRAFVKQITLKRLRNPSDSSVGVRTGAGRQSLGFTVNRGSLGADLLNVGFGPPAAPWANKKVADYMKVHEFGATIRPKNVNHLAVPVEDNLTPRGVARISSPRKLRDPAFVPHIFKSGLGYLVFEGSALMFLLLKSVTIKPRLNFFADWEDFQFRALAILRQHLDRGIQSV